MEFHLFFTLASKLLPVPEGDVATLALPMPISLHCQDWFVRTSADARTYFMLLIYSPSINNRPRLLRKAQSWAFTEAARTPT